MSKLVGPASFSCRGANWHPEKSPGRHVGQATQFILRINALRAQPAASCIATASEARFSVGGTKRHGIQRRVAALQQITPESEMDAQAQVFAREELLVAWQTIAANIAGQCAANRELNVTLELYRATLPVPLRFWFSQRVASGGRRVALH